MHGIIERARCSSPWGWALANNLGYFVYTVIVFVIIALFPDAVDRGIVCGDTSVIYPAKDEIVSKVTLVLIGIAVAVIFTFVLNVVFFLDLEKASGGWKNIKVSPKQYGKFSASVVAPTWLLYIAGGVSCYLLLKIVKVSVGKYRPHFLAVCNPNGAWKPANPWAGFHCINVSLLFAKDFNCSADSDDVNDARRSFPSGHASLGFYWIIFGVAHLQFYMTRSPKLHFIKGLLQIVLLAVATFVAFSRVADNSHGLVDVLAGIALGTGCALATFTIYPGACDRNMPGTEGRKEGSTSQMPMVTIADPEGAQLLTSGNSPAVTPTVSPGQSPGQSPGSMQP